MDSKLEDPSLRFSIKDIAPFKIWLESVKYPEHGDKNNFRDVLFQAEKRGIIMKWADYKGVVMTKAMIRKDYFHNDNFFVAIKDGDGMRDGGVEFWIPPNVLLGVMDKIIGDTVVEFAYPVKDAWFEMIIDEEHSGIEGEKVKTKAKIDFETYTPNESLRNDFSITSDNWVGNIYAKINTFKKALKELAFLEENTPVKLKFSIEYPHFQIVYNDRGHDDNYFLIKFAADPGDVRYSIKSNVSASYTIGSLRLAFSRFSRENLNCALLISTEGYLSVKIVQENKNVYIESIIANLDDGNEVDMSQ